MVESPFYCCSFLLLIASDVSSPVRLYSAGSVLFSNAVITYLTTRHAAAGNLYENVEGRVGGAHPWDGVSAVCPSVSQINSVCPCNASTCAHLHEPFPFGKWPLRSSSATCSSSSWTTYFWML